MELKQIDSFLLKVLFLVEAGIIVTQVLSLDSLTSMLFLMTFPITVLLWLRSVRQTFSGTDLIMIITAILAVVGVFLSAAKASAHLDFSSLKKLIMFVMALLFFQMAYRTRINEEMGAFIHRVVDALVVFLFVLFLLQRQQMYTLNGRRTNYLTFCFSNPNLTALFLSCMYMLKMQRLFEKGRWYVKLMHILQQVLLGWFVLETQSRNGILVVLAYTLMTIWLVFRSGWNLKISKFWGAFLAVWPAIMVVGYMTLIQSSWVLDTFSFLVGEGKELDSRETIWSLGLRHLRESPVFGAYYEMAGGTGVFQMHNSHLDIAVSYGIPVLILVCILINRYLYGQGRIYANKREYIYILGFAAAILLGMGESAVFSGGLGIYIFAGTFLLLANQKPPETRNGERL